ncbi:hypothetical protein L218DRAFT_985378, partial [Marasmius fiardii PR-910]
MLRTLSRTRSQTQTASGRSSSRPYNRLPSILVTAVDSPTARRQRDRSSPIPPEVLDRIIELAILKAFAQGVDPFASISSFSLASTHFRRVSLRRYLFHVTLRSRDHFNWLFELARKHGIRNFGDCGLLDIKSVTTDAGTITSEAPKLSYLVNLRDLDISFTTEGPTTQHTCISIVFKKLLHSSPNCSSPLTTLSLTSLSRIDISMLRLISTSFPALSRLHLSASDNVDNYNLNDICWCCFEELLSCSYYSPVPHMFPTAKDLAVCCFESVLGLNRLYFCILQTAYGQALQPLGKLKQLHLGIYLSDEELWWDHIACCKDVTATQPGECKKCQNIHSEVTLAREQIASAVIATKLPSVKVVSWNSYFNVKNVKENRAPEGAYSQRVHFDVEESGAVIR